MSTKREDYISKDELYIDIAKLIAKRSKDPNTQVGCCIVSKDDRILTMGYNGLPNGCSDDEFPWDRENENQLNTKYPYVVHSELNAILNFRGDLKAFNGSTLYVTLFPCNECAKAIIQTGIKRVIYLDDKYPESDSHKATEALFMASGVEFYQYEYDFINIKNTIDKIFDIMANPEIDKEDLDNRNAAAIIEMMGKQYDKIWEVIR